MKRPDASRLAQDLAEMRLIAGEVLRRPKGFPRNWAREMAAATFGDLPEGKRVP